jgi:outer membrane immunogenic protein
MHCELAMCERLVACAILAVLTAGNVAVAADAPILVRKAPVPIAAYDWTGIYIGGHVGAGFSYRDWTLADGSISEAGDAAMIGGQLGLNYQLGKWVVGVESDVSWGNLKDESLCPDGSNTCWTRQTWQATVTGRIGYAFDPALFYLKGGAAFTHADYFKTAQLPSVFDESAGGRRNGWTAGAGMEYALWNSWTLRLEYDYLDFGSCSFAMPNIATGAFAEDVVVRQKAHQVKLGVNYLFNASNWTSLLQLKKNKAEPEPQRTGLPAPLDSPPFPSGDWPLGGTQLIGVPDTSVGPLMKWLYDGPNGQAWK